MKERCGSWLSSYLLNCWMARIRIADGSKPHAMLFIGILRVIVDGYPDADTGNGTLVHALRNMTTSELLHYLAKHPRNHSLLRKDFGFDPAHPDRYQNNRRSERHHVFL